MASRVNTNQILLKEALTRSEIEFPTSQGQTMKDLPICSKHLRDCLVLGKEILGIGYKKTGWLILETALSKYR